jgi:hypothetical protein
LRACLPQGRSPTQTGFEQKGGQAIFFFVSPQILGLILQSQIRKFLPVRNRKSANCKEYMVRKSQIRKLPTVTTNIKYSIVCLKAWLALSKNLAASL